MAEDGEIPRTRKKETFHRAAPEAQAEHVRFPARLTGIVTVSPGSRGPRSLYLRRHGDSFGFTLRHFIVYPPDSIADCDPRYESVGAVQQPMETIFVKQVADRGPAALAGLQVGDQILSVNGVSIRDRKYNEVVQIIKKSPEYLHLLVVPKEEDIVQKYFVHANHPTSNQQPILQQPTSQDIALYYNLPQENPNHHRRQSLYHPPPDNTFPRKHANNGDKHHLSNYGTTTRSQFTGGGHHHQKSADHIYSEPQYHPHNTTQPHFNKSENSSARRQQRSLDSCLTSTAEDSTCEENAATQRHAQPQKPPRTNLEMGRKHQLNYYSDSRDSSTDYCSIASDDILVTMKPNVAGINYQNTAGCRLSLDAPPRRRESTSSLASSLTDGSKCSLNSYDSSSTLTDMDEQSRAKLRQRIQEREDFLKGGAGDFTSQDNEQCVLQQKEYYARAKKLERAMWPPVMDSVAGTGASVTTAATAVEVASPSRVIMKPAHQSVQRVRTDIDSERDLVEQQQRQQQQQQQQQAKGGKVAPFVSSLGKISEGGAGGGSNGAEDRRHYPPNNNNNNNTQPPQLQIVQTRAKQFDAGRPAPADDNTGGNLSPPPSTGDRTSYFSSELHRLSAKRVVPNVLDRTRDFETRGHRAAVAREKSVEEARNRESWGSAGNATSGNRGSGQYRDSRSLDSSGSNEGSVASLADQTKLSGNLIIPVGSKFIHCPLPSDYKTGQDMNNVENEYSSYRARSNSADSWKAPSRSGVDKPTNAFNTISSTTSRREHDMDTTVNNLTTHHPQTPLSPLIPESVALIHLTSPSPVAPLPSLSITPAAVTAVTARIQPTRPNQLDLGGNTPRRPARHLRPLQQPMHGLLVPPSGGGDETVCSDKPLVIRRTKNTNITDEDRIMRRESYLKATEGGRMNFEYDISDGEISPQVLRSGSISGNSSSSVSLEREKGLLTPTGGINDHQHSIVKEGSLMCKTTEIDGKRCGDRSWKQFWVVLRGPKLYLYKDRHHQSPVGPTEPGEQSLAGGVDVRASMVQVAADYTKRKNVLRLSSAMPCRSELLLQTDNPDDLAHWVTALQEQSATAIQHENSLDMTATRQQAEPQSVAASTSIQVQGSSRLSPTTHLPQSTKSSSKLPQLRNRSPTGLSPASKSRKQPTTNTTSTMLLQPPPGHHNTPSQHLSEDHHHTIASFTPAATSPKLKTWRGRVASKFRKIHGTSSPNSPTAPEGSTFGAPLEHCLPSLQNQYVPRLVEVCTEIVEGKALETIGIYRVPGNNAAVTALTDEVNKHFDEVLSTDARWNDVHVVSSLLKSFFRKMPDSLLTNELYPLFIRANKIVDPAERMGRIRALLRELPPFHYNTLRHLIVHLRRIVDNAGANKMEAKNLAIVFGPTIVRGEDNMQTMVIDMTHQCRIVETLLTYADWFFSDDDVELLNLPAPIASAEIFQTDPEGIRENLLRDNNINKVEGLHQTKEQKEKNRVIQTILSAAKKISNKSSNTPHDYHRGDTRIINGITDYPVISSFTNAYDLKESTSEIKTNNIPTTVTEMENSPTLKSSAALKAEFFNYKKDRDDVKKRIENFIQETESNLQRPRMADLSSNNSLELRLPNPTSYSTTNIHHHNPRLSLTTTPSMGHQSPRPITKTNSASNVFSVQQQQRSVVPLTASSLVGSCGNTTTTMGGAGGGVTGGRMMDYQVHKNSYSELALPPATSVAASGGKLVRRGSSVENISGLGGAVGVVGGGMENGGGLKKLKYENEHEYIQRSGSLDSLNKFQSNLDDGGDLMLAITQIFDEKKKQFTLSGEDLPYVDESPEKTHHPLSSQLPLTRTPLATLLTTTPGSPKLYRNPSLHKSVYTNSNSNKPAKNDSALAKHKEKKLDEEKEKDIDSSDKNIPDNERHLVKILRRSESLNKKQEQRAISPAKLKRSESLNKPSGEKLKRSDSLNKSSGEKLKRSDSLTKTEKTESNNSKRRELLLSNNNNNSSRRTNKEFTKLKRKNGMPERSIKRRHTVGGTKDPDKVTYYLDNRTVTVAPRITTATAAAAAADSSGAKENSIAEARVTLRTSSPDLSSRRERVLFEVSVIGPDVVVALRQNLIGARPVSFPETTVFNVPLESHV